MLITVLLIWKCQTSTKPHILAYSQIFGFCCQDSIIKTNENTILIGFKLIAVPLFHSYSSQLLSRFLHNELYLFTNKSTKFFKCYRRNIYWNKTLDLIHQHSEHENQGKSTIFSCFSTKASDLCKKLTLESWCWSLATASRSFWALKASASSLCSRSRIRASRASWK